MIFEDIQAYVFWGDQINKIIKNWRKKQDIRENRR